MALTPRRTLAWIIAAVASGALVLAARERGEAVAFNHALAQRDYAVAAAFASPEALFVRAWLVHETEFDAAITAYSALEPSPDSRLHTAARFNLATLYLQRGQRARQLGDDATALPLIELAKHLYRELLRGDPTHWHAKFNLEQALKLAPELPEQAQVADVMPERSPNAAGSMQVDRELP
ncbi:MAG: hypothetical protein ACFCUJ_16630 [Thiotrichales bacterium]